MTETAKFGEKTENEYLGEGGASESLPGANTEPSLAELRGKMFLEYAKELILAVKDSQQAKGRQDPQAWTIAKDKVSAIKAAITQQAEDAGIAGGVTREDVSLVFGSK